MEKSNFHAHTNYCDGKNTCEEMILAAIDKGFDAFGISEHSHTSVPGDMGILTSETMPRYFAEMRQHADKYADEIAVFAGIEQDACADLTTDGADYVIGATHFISPDGVFRYVDGGSDYQNETVDRYYGGDWIAFAEDYFRLESEIANITNCDIIGHFDLVNKNNEGDRLFDTLHPRYRDAAIASMERILRTCNLVEVNTGAMYRFGRTAPYPAPWLLKELLARGGEVILSSDSHDIPSLGYKFDEMEELLRSIGFKYRKTLTKDGFVDIKL